MKVKLSVKKILVLAQSVVVASVLLCPIQTYSDQAQYFYDELGQLVGVVDGEGNVAVYNYDAVGNLLSIDRFTSGETGIGIFLLTPASGVVGTNVEIRGFGFSLTPSENQVQFNGTVAPVVSASANAVLATVPTGATTGPVTVTKITTNDTATSPRAFTVLVPPIIVGIVPDRAPQGASTRMVIDGFNLADATAVTFSQSGLSAGIQTGATAQSLPVNVTVGATVPAGTYAFSVTTPSGTAQSGTIQITITAAVPSVGLGKASVFLPAPDGVPGGPSFGLTPPTSVQMP